MYTESAGKGFEVPANDNSCVIWKKLQLGLRRRKFLRIRRLIKGFDFAGVVSLWFLFHNLKL